MVKSEESRNHHTPVETAHVEGAGSMGDQQQAAQQKTREAVNSAKERGEHVVDKAQALGQSAAAGAREQAERQKERAAERIADVASDLRDRGSRLRDGQATQKITGAAAESMDRASDFLHDRRTGDTLEKVRAYTRAHPGTALIVAGIAGLIFGRTLFR